MNVNNQFLAQFMREVDMRMFTPSLYRFFTEFLEIERVRKYGHQYVVSNFIPPFPGKAFDRFMETFFGDQKAVGVQAVDLAVTNACMFNCRHCYNAGRLVADPDTDELKNLITKLQRLGAFVINLTGGEPCLRADLPDICRALNDDTAAIVSTTGYGFTDQMATQLREEGVYAVSISLDSADEVEHDRSRGIKGAFQIAIKGIETALKHGFYTYTCVVPNKNTLEEEIFANLVALNKNLGVMEIQVLEPAPAGKLLNSSRLLEPSDFETICRYMTKYNTDVDGPAISSFAHLESPKFFGCGAGFSHIYIDGTGEISPCNMLPVTYGNAYHEHLDAAVARMQMSMKSPCRTCRAYVQRDFFQTYGNRGHLIHASTKDPLSGYHDRLPGFYEILAGVEMETAGIAEIVAGYSKASETYDDYWLTVASGPVDDLMKRLHVPPGAAAVDCGCGTGYTTVKLARKVGPNGRVIGIDLTEAMIARARQRFAFANLNRTEFRIGDILTELDKMPPASVDTATTTWLIGYVSCEELFPRLARVMKPGGEIGFVAHLDRSPEVPFQVFEDLIRENPDVMDKAVRMKFPDCDTEVHKTLENAGFEARYLHCGTFTVVCRDGREVLDHVMRSGAGSTFYHAIRPACRERLTAEFIRRIEVHYGTTNGIPIMHRYVVGTAAKKV